MYDDLQNYHTYIIIYIFIIIMKSCFLAHCSVLVLHDPKKVMKFDIKSVYREYKVSVFITSLPGKSLKRLLTSQGLFSKLSLVNLISKDANLVFYLSVYPLFHSSN